MHPPLDRPHPDCQMEVDELRKCHEISSRFRFWACNEAKLKLDRCFRQEKQRMLKEVNKDLDERRREEEAQAAISTGRNVMFQEYLESDITYQNELKDLKENRGKAWFGF